LEKGNWIDASARRKQTSRGGVEERNSAEPKMAEASILSPQDVLPDFAGSEPLGRPKRGKEASGVDEKKEKKREYDGFAYLLSVLHHA